MRKVLSKLQIRSKKDWLIAFVFSFLLVYLVVLRFQVEINEFLMSVTPDKISFFNQPEDEGVYAVTVFSVSLLSIGVMIYKKTRGKYIALALAGGIVIAGAAMGSYFYQCHQMLKIPFEYGPEGVIVSSYDSRNQFRVNYELDEETERQLVEKTTLLEPLSDKETQKLAVDDSDESGEEISISIWYPRNGGYSYHVWVYIKDNIIRIHKGHSSQFDPVYQDNGLLEIIDQIKNEDTV